MVIQILHTIEEPFAISFPQALIGTLESVRADLLLVARSIQIVLALEVGASQLLPILPILRHLRAVLRLTRIVEEVVGAIHFFQLFDI